MSVELAAHLALVAPGGHAPVPVSFVIFMLVVAAVGTAVYLMVFMSHVPGAADERLGALEPLPDRLGEWVRDEQPVGDGTIREQRILLGESMGMGSDKLVRQVRFRDAKSNQIGRVLPEEVLRRRRVKPGQSVG